jgi:hypothetical protein
VKIEDLEKGHFERVVREKKKDMKAGGDGTLK